MAIKFSCSACGQKLRVKDDHAGRQSKCPGCGWGLTVPMESEADQVDGPLPDEPPPVPSAVSHATVSPTHDTTADPPLPRRPRLARMVLKAVAGLLAIAVIAAGAEGYARWRISRLPIPQSVSEVRAVSIAQKREAIPGPVAPPAASPKSKVGPPYDPKVIETVARMYPSHVAGSLYRRSDDVKDIRVIEARVERADPDRRRIDWLWKGYIRFDLVQKDGSENMAMEMNLLFHLAPSGEEWECSRDVTILIGKGFTQHVNLKSPWKDWFEAQVHQAWEDAIRDISVDRADIGAIKDRVAERFQITAEEFNDIMHPGESPGFSARDR